MHAGIICSEHHNDDPVNGGTDPRAQPGGDGFLLGN